MNIELTPPSDIKLLEKLAGFFAPSGCEDSVRSYTQSLVSGISDRCGVDRAGNLLAYFDINPSLPTLLVSAHMDEVGFMITDITDSGYLKFGKVGGIDDSVLVGCRVLVGDSEKNVPGVISSMPTHLIKRDERDKATKADNLYIDIGARDKDDACGIVAAGDYAVFDSDFIEFGKDRRYIKGKALDDRAGCAALIEVMRKAYPYRAALPVNVCFAFTVREEVGISGAFGAAFTVAPDFAVVIETTAVADIADTPESKRVASLGNGGVLSLMDRATIYDRGLINTALLLGKRKGIACQIKKYVSGGNDASSIHRSRSGVKTLALSVPTRYLHTPSCVIDKNDYYAVRDLLFALVCNIGSISELKGNTVK